MALPTIALRRTVVEDVLCDPNIRMDPVRDAVVTITSCTGWGVGTHWPPLGVREASKDHMKHMKSF